MSKVVSWFDFKLTVNHIRHKVFSKIKQSALFSVVFLSLVVSFSHVSASEKIRLSGSTGTSATLIWVAERIGAFKRHDIEVEIVPFDAGWQSVKALREGKVDLAAATAFAFVKMGMDDPDLMIVSQLCRDQDNGIVGNKLQGITDLSDLAGKRIGLTKGTSGEFFLAHSLISHGLLLEDVNLIHLPPDQLPGNLRAVKVDVISSWEPWNYKASELLDGDSVTFPVEQGQETLFLLIGEQPWLAGNDKSVQKVLSALAEAEAFLQKEDAEKLVLSLYQERFSYDKEFTQYVYRKQVNGLGLPQSMLHRLETQADWILREHNDAQVPNYLDRIYFKGLETVSPQSISIIR